MLPGNFRTLANFFFGAGNPLAVLHFDSHSSSVGSEDSDDTDETHGAIFDIVNPLEALLLPRSCVTYAHYGEMLRNNDSTSPDTAKHKNKLNAVAYDIRWMSEFGMTKATFDELLVLV